MLCHTKMEDPEDILKVVTKHLEPLGLESYPFQVGWYNDHVKPSFHLKHDPDTLAISVVSTPSMFDKALKPFIMRKQCSGLKDPLDECISELLNKIVQDLPGLETEVLHDYEVDHMRRPKILVQTAGHISGAARYYQRSDIKNDPWPEKKRIFGVSIHPNFGGWFAFRGVIVFKNVKASNLENKGPPDPVPEDADRIELLRRFNEGWQDWTFRDIIPVNEKYSEEQKLYFATLPKDRMEVVKKIASGQPCGIHDEEEIRDLGHTSRDQL